MTDTSLPPEKHKAHKSPLSNVITPEAMRQLLKYIDNIAARHSHKGHPVLNRADLYLHGQELLVLLLKQLHNKPQRSRDMAYLKSCLRTRFVQDIFDLRKSWCLSQSRGRTTVQISHMEAVTQGEWVPSETMYGSAVGSIEESQDFVDAFERVQPYMTDVEFTVCYAHFILGCDTSEIETMLDLTKDSIRHTLETVTSKLRSAGR